MPGSGDDIITLHVCVTCRAPDESKDDADKPNRAGARLHRALLAAAERGLAPNIRVEAVECLSVCKRPATVAVAASGKWTYVYGDLDPETSAETILAGLGLYGAAPDGIVPWKERPDAFKRGVIARIPPLGGATAEVAS
jgi:predicted metal-binding protein